MKVTVIIIIYNSEKYLEKSIKSVLNQSYSNIELILYDNCSTDKSSSIIENIHDRRIKYFKSQMHTNLSKARENALKKSSTEWIAFLDSDDYWHPKKLEKQVEVIKSRSNDIGLVYTDYLIDNNTKITNSNFQCDDLDFSKLLLSNPIVFSSIIFSKLAIKSEVKFDPILKYAEDYDLLLKISKNKKIIFVNEKLTYYRVHKENLSIKYELRALSEIRYILRKYADHELSFLSQKKLNNNIKKIYLKKFIKFFFQLKFCKMIVILQKRLIKF